MPKVVAVCISGEPQEPKRPVDAARFVVARGVEGDAHFGSGRRQVSLLRSEDIREAGTKAGFPFPPGGLAENLVVEGMAERPPLGTVLRFDGGAALRVVEHGKAPGEPHSYDYRGWCLLPDVGIFLEVTEGGEVRPGEECSLTLPES
ncbi:MAG: MOSC domain-containing protein [Synergistales bacterium]|nr:MOSC domain-containing protein [Synergistales bacterium]